MRTAAEQVKPSRKQAVTHRGQESHPTNPHVFFEGNMRPWKNVSGWKQG